MSVEPIRALVIGARDNGEKRNIGGELVSRITLPKWSTSVLTSTSARIRNESGCVEHPYDPKNPREFTDILCAVRPEIVFIAVPTPLGDCGQTALGYALPSLHFGAYVDTAEKGIASWEFGQIASWLNKVDLGASVGGGNRFLYQPKLQHLRGRKVTFYGILNATCSFLGWAIGEGTSPDDAIYQAEHRGIAEPRKPGSDANFRGIINGELPDKRMKVAAAFNKLFARKDKYLRPSALGQLLLSEEDADRLLNPHDKRRLLVTITNQLRDANHHRDVIGHMQAEMDGWYISIGFVSVGSSPVGDWIEGVKDIDNGILAYIDGHRFKASGPGAGRVTVDAMLEGAARWFPVYGE